LLGPWPTVGELSGVVPGLTTAVGDTCVGGSGAVPAERGGRSVRGARDGDLPVSGAGAHGVPRVGGKGRCDRVVSLAVVGAAKVAVAVAPRLVDRVIDCADRVLYSSGRVTAVTNGYCYLWVIKKTSTKEAVNLLGPWPTIDELLETPRCWFANDRLGCARATEEVEGLTYHIETRDGVGDVGVLPLFAIRRVAATGGSWPAGSLGDDDTLWEGVTPASCAGVDGDTDIGGYKEYFEAYKKRCGPGGPQLGSWLASAAGEPGHVFADADLVVISKTAAMHATEDKRRLRMLEATGDATITLAVAIKCANERRTAEEYQNARSAVTSNPALSALYARVAVSGFVTVPGGVDPGLGKVGAGIIEAFIGLTCEKLGLKAAMKLCGTLGVFDLYSW